jgi:hypothetical protein
VLPALAFYKNSSLATVTFEADSSLNSIGAEAFNETPITSITIPPLVTFIGHTNFIDCSGLSQVTFTGNMIPPLLVGTNTPVFPPISQNITAYYTQDLSQNYIDILKATFKYVIGPDLFTFLDSPTLGTDYTYLVQNGSSSISDKYSIISVLPTSSNGVKFTINPGYGTDYGDFQVGVVLVGPGETPPSPPTNQGSPMDFVNSSGGQGGASIYADLSANDISNNAIIIQSGITNVSGQSNLVETSMEISNVNTKWICGNTLSLTAGGSNITYKSIKESSSGGYGGGSFTVDPVDPVDPFGNNSITWLNQDLSGNDSDWKDTISFMGSDISLNGYGGGGGTGENNEGSGGMMGVAGQVGQAGQGGVGGHSGTSAPETAQPGYYNPQASPGGGGGGPSMQTNTSGWTNSGNGGSGLAYFYIGFKAPTTP